MFKVYLAGSTYTDEPDVSWKNNLMNQIRFLGYIDKFVFYDPNPAVENNLDSDLDIRFHVVPKDKKIISESDIVVAYVQRPSFGTAMEIEYAYDKGTIQVLTINPNGNYKDDIWLNHHSHKMFDSVNKCAKELCWISDAMLVYGNI